MAKKTKRRVTMGVDLAAKGDTGYAVFDELQSDGTHRITSARPFLRSAISAATKTQAEEIYEKAKTLVSGWTTLGPLTVPSKTTFTPGHVRVRMAHPVSPFPYGTIIKPTPTNMSFPPEHRQMVIGLAPGNDDAICAIFINTDAPLTHGGRFYLHTLANIVQRWTEAEEDS